jgi:hypothetical protein
VKRNILIEQKKVIIVCEESGFVSLSYNVLLTTPKANVILKFVVPIIIVKSTLTCTDCGKISPLVETYHIMKRKVPVMPTNYNYVYRSYSRNKNL